MDSNNRTPIVDMLIKYNEEVDVRFHMPGHKGSLDCENFSFLSQIARYDVTEVPGTDDLHNPTEAILIGEKLLAKAYGAAKSFFLVNGSTSGILTAISSAFYKNDTILIYKNCHYSVFNAIDLLNIGSFIISDLSFKNIKKMTSIFKCKGLIITRPDYYGVCVDIKAISEICRKLNLILITDEAHGAHLNFADPDSGYPESALKYSDFTIQSAHKTIGALNQSSFLHLNNNGMSYYETVRKNLAIFQTSSPSYIILASADLAISNMVKNGKKLLDDLLKNINYTVSEIEKRTPLRVQQGKSLLPGLTQTPDRLVIDTISAGFIGYSVEKYLRTKRIQVELSDENKIVCICTIFDKPNDFKKLVDALEEMIGHSNNTTCECSEKIEDKGGAIL